MMTNHTKKQPPEHAEMARQIRLAKKSMFKYHREGGDLEKLIDVFSNDVRIRLRKIVQPSDSAVQAEPDASNDEEKPDPHLTDVEIERLARIICCCGDDPELQTAAFVRLMQEIQDYHTEGESYSCADVAATAAQAAFGNSLFAQVAMHSFAETLRGEPGEVAWDAVQRITERQQKQFRTGGAQ